MKVSKRGEIGISAMILLIGGILIVALITSLYLASTNKLQVEAYKNTEKTERFITSQIVVTDIYSKYTADGRIKNITMLLKAQAGSSPIKLDYLTIGIKSEYETGSVTFKGGAAALNHSAEGYYTYGEETYTVPSFIAEDLDSDNLTDRVVINASYAQINLSSTSTPVVLGNCTSGTFRSVLGANTYVKNVTGTCSSGLPNEVTFWPRNYGNGFYVVKYLIASNRHLDGMLNPGDVVEFIFEMPRGLTTEETVTISIIPQTGMPITSIFITPDTVSTGRVNLGHY